MYFPFLQEYKLWKEMQLRKVAELFVLWWRAIMPNYALRSIYSRFTLHWLLIIPHVHGNAFKFHLSSGC